MEKVWRLSARETLINSNAALRDLKRATARVSHRQCWVPLRHAAGGERPARDGWAGVTSRLKRCAMDGGSKTSVVLHRTGLAAIPGEIPSLRSTPGLDIPGEAFAGIECLGALARDPAYPTGPAEQPALFVIPSHQAVSMLSKEGLDCELLCRPESYSK